MAKPENAPPQALMLQTINGKLVSRCISLVAELAIADHLGNGPKSAGSLAAATGTNADALYRVLRALASVGIFTELPDRQFQNNTLSETLRGDVAGSLRHYARWFGTGFHWKMVSDLDYSVATGRPSPAKEHPDQDCFEILAQDHGAQETFNDAMSALSVTDGIAVVESYDFTPFRRIIDVGGGHGGLAVTIAKAAPHAKLRVLDLSHVIAGTRKRIENSGLQDRIEAIAGSFFETVPGPADLCVLKHIIHDWNDELSTRILAHCRSALENDGRVLVCEMLISQGSESIPAKLFDVEMLVGPGGRERTESEFAHLFAAARLKLNRIIETSTPLRLLEAVSA